MAVTTRAMLGPNVPNTPIVIDTNVFINALAGRGPVVLRDLLQVVPRLFVAAPSRAELSWVSGRLDPEHPGTERVLALYAAQMARIDAAKVLVPDDGDWLAAGRFAGTAARVMAGGGRAIAAASDRVELISDALIAILALKARLTIVTADLDFEVLARIIPGLAVLFYDPLPRPS